jgi:hypothetical protein
LAGLSGRKAFAERVRLLGRVGFFTWSLGITVLAGCSGALPRPPATQVEASDYVPVPFAPRVPPVEFIPPSPSKNAVWVDGSWEWSGRRYGWRYGSWVIPPANARHARWVVVRREEDGQLFFAPSDWKDASGKHIEARSFVTALGPHARARSRLGAPPPAATSEDEARGISGPSETEPVDTGADTGDPGD